MLICCRRPQAPARRVHQPHPTRRHIRPRRSRRGRLDPQGVRLQLHHNQRSLHGIGDWLPDHDHSRHAQVRCRERRQALDQEVRHEGCERGHSRFRAGRAQVPIRPGQPSPWRPALIGSHEGAFQMSTLRLPVEDWQHLVSCLMWQCHYSLVVIHTLVRV